MSEIRYDITTGNWVILAGHRSDRPNHHRQMRENPHQTLVCPFCPENESETPKEVFSIRKSGSANGPGWEVRAFPNKYPILNANIQDAGILDGLDEEKDNLFPKVMGFGFHEVIVETPKHDVNLTDLAPEEMETVIKAYRSRYRNLQNDKRIKIILIFRNYGERAGASIPHPHAQILGSPLLPKAVQNRFQLAQNYYRQHKRSVFKDYLEQEVRLGTRIIDESKHFVTLAPFAARTPYETWVLPKNHQASFGEISSPEIPDFSQMIQRTLRRLDRALDKPHYNFIIYSAPHNTSDKAHLDPEYNHFYLWHLKIFIRMVTFAGFEIGSGMAINSILPEDAAKILREIHK